MMFYLMIFVLSCIVNYALLYLFNRYKLFQPQREEIDHKPIVVTCGGLSFLISILFMIKSDFYLVLLCWSMGLLGLLDDYLKIKVQNAWYGLKSIDRLLYEFFVAAVYIYVVGLRRFDLSIGLVCFWGAFVIVSTLNAVNTTDGIDGLASTIALWVLLFLYLKTFDPFALILMVSLFSFLFFNFPPAKIYMGDVGALSLGTAIAGLYLKHGFELYLLLIACIFVLEVFTSFVQIMSIRKFKKKIFKMAPFHHHLLLNGYTRNKVLILFNCISFIVFFVSYYFL